MNLKIALLALTFLFSSAFIIDDFSIEIHKIDPEKIYKSNCRLCHGSKGSLGINGATNLKHSTISNAEIIEVIREGRGVMTPFKDILDEKEIKALAKYVNKLRK